MKNLILPIAMAVVLAVVHPDAASASFREEQARYPRVKAAYEKRGRDVERMFRERDLPWPPRGVFLRAFKKEAELELWGRKGKGEVHVLVKTYPICASSGVLGPKRRSGDGQVPEGFYRVRAFNPASRFHLSLGIDYPNASDRILGRKGRLGGDIFIHGDCVTIGCIPVTDPFIEEIYIAAVEARSNGQRDIPVHIFPGRLDERGMSALLKGTGAGSALGEFWINLREEYERFERTRIPAGVAVDGSGRYRIGTRPAMRTGAP